MERRSRPIQLDPKATDAYVLRSGVHLDLKHYDAALVDCNTALSLEPNHVAALNYRGLTWRNLGETKQAIADFEAALRLDGQHPSALFNKADLEYEQREYEKAIAGFSAFLDQQPDNYDVLFRRGCCHGNIGHFEAADQDLTDAIRWLPECGVCYFHRGFYRGQCAREVDALVDFEWAMKLSSKDPVFHCGAAQLCLKKETPVHNVEKAIEYAQRACELSTWSVSGYMRTLAEAHFENRNPTSAARVQRQAIEAASEGFDIEKAKMTLKIYEREARNPNF